MKSKSVDPPEKVAPKSTRLRRKRQWACTLSRAFLMAVIYSSSICTVNGAEPLALNNLIEVKLGTNAVISLRGYDLDGDETTATITSLPSSGSLYQLSDVYNKYGYDPKEGTLISSVPTIISGKDSRLVYTRPSIDREVNDKWASFTYSVSDNTSNSVKDGTVTLVGPSHILVASDFTFSDEDWTTNGNKVSNIKYEPTSRGLLMNHYIYAYDDLLNVDKNGDDTDLWYFEAPAKFNGWQAMAYNGYIDFTLASFSGDFSADNLNYAGEGINLVEMYCRTCNNAKGMTIAYPLQSSPGFDGSITKFTIPIHEGAGWKKKPENVLHPWTDPTKCDMIKVLSNVASIRILGDFTKWYESVTIDDVQLRTNVPAGRRQLPPCAHHEPCSCPPVT
mmetsp:Transcript_33434/g.48406  ORF Transcript_33434/g.48406 Transcript_33434/m.48406 type:complete len:391 (-) Transcript_33434:55-1227(-)|eukprot:CAMPEP_0116026384 /NCGR_PEP_ID=MMETSP0321-20121206/13800_1 /TAXON_ID=163516 /ORGANISM="Leptocylindrus danicus var. danicus, Strain B650" /LENGTH=390 /DNA_ID=CAMNT_0003499135 /DNA_START=417 /DNA_END=1589 /DNA_ORIENTATION=+